MKIKFATRNAAIRIAVLSVVCLAAAYGCYYCMLKMPGTSFQGTVIALNDQQARHRDNLILDVGTLAGTIGCRDLSNYEQLKKAADYISKTLACTGLPVVSISYTVEGRQVRNIVVEKRGVREPDKIIIIGAHYDSAAQSPGADDNASGVAVMLALARGSRDKTYDRTIRFVAFPNGEMPWFHTEQMGSMVYARFCFDCSDKIVAMLSLDSLGCYRDEQGTQSFPFPYKFFYSPPGDFVALVGNYESRDLVRTCTRIFRKHALVASHGAALPSRIRGVSESDHSSFWKGSYPAIMITDTASFRNPWYHTAQDTPDKIDYYRLTYVVEGLDKLLDDLAGRTVKRASNAFVKAGRE